MSYPNIPAVILLATMCAVVGCTPTTIHLHDRHLPDEKVARVASALESAGFKVVVRENRHPAALLGSILLYRPEAHSQKQVDMVYEAVGQAGLSLNGAYPTDVGMHSYTEGNMGLYLVDGDMVQVEWDAPGNPGVEFSITDFEPRSTDCETPVVFTFGSGGELVLRELSGSDEKLRHLRWAKEGPATIAVFDSRHKYQFHYLRYQRQREYKGREIRDYFVELEPVDFYPLPYACSYRGKQSALLY